MPVIFLLLVIVLGCLILGIKCRIQQRLPDDALEPLLSDKHLLLQAAISYITSIDDLVQRQQVVHTLLGELYGWKAVQCCGQRWL